MRAALGNVSGTATVTVTEQVPASFSVLGTVTFRTSDSDPGVVLPPDDTFQPGDRGMTIFAGGVTLSMPGNPVLTVADTTSGITGGAVVTVTPEPRAVRRARWHGFIGVDEFLGIGIGDEFTHRPQRASGQDLVGRLS